MTTTPGLLLRITYTLAVVLGGVTGVFLAEMLMRR